MLVALNKCLGDFGVWFNRVPPEKTHPATQRNNIQTSAHTIKELKRKTHLSNTNIQTSAHTIKELKRKTHLSNTHWEPSTNEHDTSNCLIHLLNNIFNLDLQFSAFLYTSSRSSILFPNSFAHPFLSRLSLGIQLPLVSVSVGIALFVDGEEDWARLGHSCRKRWFRPLQALYKPLDRVGDSGCKEKQNCRNTSEHYKWWPIMTNHIAFCEVTC